MATILMVEDDDAMARRLGWVLSEAGHGFHTVHSDGDVTGAVESLHPDVVIFNSEMAPPDKAAVIDDIRLRSPKVIDLHTHDLTSDGGHRRGAVQADGYIHKPFDADDLLAMVERLASVPPSHQPA
jgi:two-component system response regulator GlrR